MPAAVPTLPVREESLSVPFLSSALLHGFIAGAAIGFALWEGPRRTPFGDERPMPGGSISITTTARIPVPTRDAPPNPVARDTDSVAPAPPPKPEPPKPRAPEPDAVPLKGREVKPQRTPPRPTSTQRYETLDKPNQVFDRGGPAASSPLYGMPGSGGIGLTDGSPFKGRFGDYERLIRRLVGEKWRTQDVDARLQTAPPVTIAFDILRDGTARNVRVAQPSGNYSVDRSAQRAIFDVGRFPPLPAAFERDVAAVEFTFRLQR